MVTFNVALLIILIGVWTASSVGAADEKQNQNKTENEGGLKHLFGTDVFTELQDKQNAMAEKMSGIETKLEKQIENGGGTFALMTLLTSNRLEKEIEDGMRENQNLMAEKMSGIEAKLEKQIENGMRDNQNALGQKVSEIGTKLENQIENGMREIQNALAMKVSETEAKLENQIEKVFTELSDNQNGLANGIRNNQKALSLMKNMATLAFVHLPLPIFRWNASDCHPQILINESTNSIQHNNETEEGYFGTRSCRAGPIKMPSAVGRVGIIYTEYRVVVQNGPISIGLSTKEMPLYKWVGDGRVSYGYANFGKIEGKNANGNEVNILNNVPPFYTGDDVGCGLNLATRQLFFTKNGQRLNITNLYVDKDTSDFYPTVTFFEHGDAVEANFGPNFKYDLSKKF